MSSKSGCHFSKPHYYPSASSDPPHLFLGSLEFDVLQQLLRLLLFTCISERFMSLVSLCFTGGLSHSSFGSLKPNQMPSSSLNYWKSSEPQQERMRNIYLVCGVICRSQEFSENINAKHSLPHIRSPMMKNHSGSNYVCKHTDHSQTSH